MDTDFIVVLKLKGDPRDPEHTGGWVETWKPSVLNVDRFTQDEAVARPSAGFLVGGEARDRVNVLCVFAPLGLEGVVMNVSHGGLYHWRLWVVEIGDRGSIHRLWVD